MMILLYIAALCFFIAGVPYEPLAPNRTCALALGALFITVYMIAGGR